MRDLRGNVETRLRKLHQGQYQAIVLAAAGLARLGLADEPAWSLPLEVVLPAVGQAALAVESRAADQAVLAAAAPLDDAATRAAVTAERAMLAALQGGCLAPVAAWARIENQALTLAGRVLSPDGARRLEAAHTAPAGQAETLGRQVAEALLAQGAAELIAAARQT
jgi:hydroxymethylbilane synthase